MPAIIADQRNFKASETLPGICPNHKLVFNRKSETRRKFVELHRVEILFKQDMGYLQFHLTYHKI